MKDRLTLDLASGALHDALADIAEAAAAVILPHWRTGGAVFSKADDSPVTLADREAEALILSRLAALYPEVQAVAEEQSEAEGKPERAAERFWLIDPLDGTKGFVQGKESFTVNIALIEGDRPTVGVVSAPATSVTWRTAPGGGAQMRRYGDAWRTIQVRNRPDEGFAPA